jgi:hypothetical protein
VSRCPVSDILRVSIRRFNLGKRYKVKFILEQAIKGQKGSTDIALLFLKLDARGGWTVNALRQLLYPREWPGTHCIGGCLDPRACMDGYAKSRPPSGFDPQTTQPRSYINFTTPLYRTSDIRNSFGSAGSTWAQHMYLMDTNYAWYQTYIYSTNSAFVQYYTT